MARSGSVVAVARAGQPHQPSGSDEMMREVLPLCRRRRCKVEVVQVYGTTVATRGREHGDEVAVRIMTVPRRRSGIGRLLRHWF
jgi:hypothetical protein